MLISTIPRLEYAKSIIEDVYEAEYEYGKQNPDLMLDLISICDKITKTVSKWERKTN